MTAQTLDRTAAEHRPEYGRLVAAELLKARTTRAAWILALVAVVLPLVFPVGSIFTKAGLAPDVQVAALSVSVAIVALVIVALGALMVTSEFRHQTVVPTTLAVPRRGLILAVKYAAAAIFAAVLTVVSLAATAITVACLAAGTGEHVDIADDLLMVVPGAIAGVVLWTWAGVAIGSALRNSAGALVGIYLGWAVLPMVVSSVKPALTPWVQPLDAVGAIADLSDKMSIQQALATLALWIAVPAAVGLLALRRDVA